MKKKKIRILNCCDGGGYSSTIKAGYYKMGRMNFIGRDDGMRAPCVVEIIEHDERKKESKNNC